MNQKDLFSTNNTPNENTVPATAWDRRADIARRMKNEPFAGCVVFPETEEYYTVLDVTGKVEITVDFDDVDETAPYVFYVNKEGKVCADTFEEVKNYICDAVRKKLIKLQKRPPVQPSIHKLILHYDRGVPMAFICADTLDGKAPAQSCWLQMKKNLDDNFRTYGFGYHLVRVGSAEGDTFFVVYGQPNKKSEQLLKVLATELGREYTQKTVGFCDLNGQICHLSADGEEETAEKDLQAGILGYYAALTGCDRADPEKALGIEMLNVSRNYAPIKKFHSTSRRLRRHNSFAAYCNECWDEKSQTYHFDQRLSLYLEVR